MAMVSRRVRMASTFPLRAMIIKLEFGTLRVT